MATYAPSDQGSGHPGAELGDGCVACGSDRVRAWHDVPEAMFRTGGCFTYRECDTCGSLQIDAVPADLAAYYDPARYYSFAGPARGSSGAGCAGLPYGSHSG